MWNDEKGFGFVEVGEYPHDFDLFFHISSCNGVYQPTRGDVVTLVREYNETKGKFQAVDIIPTGEAVDCRFYFDNRVSRKRLDEARQNSLRYERGCTCATEDYELMMYGKCWYCNEMND